MRQHFTDSDGVGAIFPPIIYTIISLNCLGYAKDSPEMVYALKQLDDLMIEEEDTMRVQPCFSPVWDTALSVNALALARSSNEERTETAINRATRWLIDREVRRPGDWSLLNPKVEPAGWFFEYRNGFYPDTDDTAMVLMGLAQAAMPGNGRILMPRNFISTGKTVNLSRAMALPQKTSPRSSAGCAGCWPCRTRTAAGRHSTATSIATF